MDVPITIPVLEIMSALSNGSCIKVINLRVKLQLTNNSQCIFHINIHYKLKCGGNCGLWDDHGMLLPMTLLVSHASIPGEFHSILFVRLFKNMRDHKDEISRIMLFEKEFVFI